MFLEQVPKLSYFLGGFWPTFLYATFLLKQACYLFWFRQARRIWRNYFPAVDGVVFLIDVADTVRMSESKCELDHLLGDEQIKTIPILILGNKIDREDAVGEEFIRNYYGLHGVTTGRNNTSEGVRPVELFMSSVKKRQGYGEGFRWLSNFLN